MALGLKLDKKKEYVQGNWAITPVRLPSKVHLAFPKSAPQSLVWQVHPGDPVKTGEIVAHPRDPSAGFLHSSVTGSVTRFLEVNHAFGGRVPAVEILCSPKEERLFSDKPETCPAEPLRADQLLEIFSRHGLQTMEEDERYLHHKIKQESLPGRGALILNACESEPYVTSQTCLLLSHPLEVLKGADYLRQALGANRIILALESDAEEAAERVRSKAYFLKWKHLEILFAGSHFPQDDPRLLKRSVQTQHGLSFQETAVYSAAAAFPVYEAVVRGKPLMERALSLAGGCMAESRNVWARMGTLSEDLFRSGKGMLREPGKRIAGGPMRGHLLPDGATPLSGGMNALLALPKELTAKGESGPCVRCGHCLDVCPVNLSPALITLAAEYQDWDACSRESVNDCLECGSCTYVCPSNRPLGAWLREAKEKTGAEDFKLRADNPSSSFSIVESQRV